MRLSLPAAPAPRPLRWSLRTLLWASLPALALLIRHRRLALFTAGANLGTLGATHLIKFTVGRVRPREWLVPVDSGSYPSGHVSATVAAAVTTAVVLGRVWIWIRGDSQRCHDVQPQVPGCALAPRYDGRGAPRGRADPAALGHRGQ